MKILKRFIRNDMMIFRPLPYALAWQNVQLSLGILMAWLLSLLSMAAWIRRLPTALVVFRRRLRKAVMRQNTIAPHPDQGRLWRQSRALPGNRTDGFRFDYLVLMMILTPLYLWLELSFGVNLLDTMGGDASSEDTDAIEHWGRLISGLAVALVFFKSWCEHCEKWNNSWPLRIIVSLCIGLVCIVLTWFIQDAVIEFYVQRAMAQVQLSLIALALLVWLCTRVILAWLRGSMGTQGRALVPTLAGLAVLLGISMALVNQLGAMISALTKYAGWTETITQKMGQERLQAASLALVRRGIQQQWYSVAESPVAGDAVHSAAGKATLALFPIVGVGMDQTRLAADRPQVVRELMYRDWTAQNGKQSFTAFQDVVNEMRQRYSGPYQEANLAYRTQLKTNTSAAAAAFWAQRAGELFDDPNLPPNLDSEQFMRSPASTKYIRLKLGCFDCQFDANMDQDAYTREVFKWTQKASVQAMQDLFDSPEHFQRGHDGEAAARAYWVPIWALLFSMLGAFTHLFKIAFTVVEYMVRKTLRQANAADSEIAHRLVRNAKALLALPLIILALFIYFTDNRVTGSDNYTHLHQRMWSAHPLVGAIATHWTINAQELIYPFTRKIRPAWLRFESDPLNGIISRRDEI